MLTIETLMLSSRLMVMYEDPQQDQVIAQGRVGVRTLWLVAPRTTLFALYGYVDEL